jgi:hypothetical protein
LLRRRPVPTTDAGAAEAALGALESANVDFAVLHGSERLEGDGPLSDVDIVVFESPATVIARARGALQEREMVPIVMWPYDIGGSTTVFLCTAGATSGVQLDMLHDPRGLGTYRLATDGFRFEPSPSHPHPEVIELDRLIYLWSKRSVKGQVERLEAIEADLAAWDPAEVQDAAGRLITRDDWRRAVTGAPAGHPRVEWSSTWIRAWLRGRRILQRVRSPIGFWAHLTGDRGADAEVVVDRFRRILVRAVAAESPGGPNALPWYLQTVTPVRLRPGLVVSYGAVPRGVPVPDLVVADAEDVDEAAKLLVSAMADRQAT